MSAVLKCILALCVVLCLVQFIEMARVPRDEPAKDGKDPAVELMNNLQNLVGDVVEKLKTVAESEQVKKLIDDTTKALSDTAKAAQIKLAELSQNVANAAVEKKP